MIDEITRSLLDRLPRSHAYDLSVVHDPETQFQALSVTIDGQSHLPGIGYESAEQFEFDREQITEYLLTRSQKCGGCGQCSCG